jgi:hypothetical protein
MNFILQRFSDNKKSTLGLLFKKSTESDRLIFFSYTLEDEFRASKVSGETRIPAGFYELVIRKQDTPLTKKYQDRYPWFKHHIEVKNVPGFTGVYMHIGNTDQDTDGCILLGDNADNNNLGNGSISNSTQAFRRFYENLYNHLIIGKAFLEIRDEKSLIKPI